MTGIKAPSGIQLFKLDNVNTRTMCNISPELTTKTPEWHQ